MSFINKGTYNIIDMDIIHHFFNAYSNLYNNFFIKNCDFYYEYYENVMIFLFEINNVLKFTREEYYFIKVWIRNIFESFNYLPDNLNLNRYSSYLFSLISAIELLIKKIYLEHSQKNEWIKEQKISQLLIKDRDFDTFIFPIFI